MRALEASEIEFVAGSFPYSEFDTYLEGYATALGGAAVVVSGGFQLMAPGGQPSGIATIVLGSGIMVTGSAIEISAISQWYYG